MKTTSFRTRLTGEEKRYFEAAARFDPASRSLSDFAGNAFRFYTNHLRSQGWKAKDPPARKDGRVKKVSSR